MTETVHSLVIRDLSKSFRSNSMMRVIPVLKQVNLAVEKGEIYGFLGPNGAGKTTTIKCIVGLISIDKGLIEIEGLPSTSLAARRLIGFLPEQPYFYDYLNAREFMQLCGDLFALKRPEVKKRIPELLELVGLKDKGNLKLRKFSKGMLQRLGIAQALLNDPRLLILDEPFSGLDPIGRKELRDLILSLKDQGKTIFFSSHILQDMEAMVDRIGIIWQGAMIREGKLLELISSSILYHDIIFTAPDSCPWARDIAEVTGQGNYSARARDEAEANTLISRIIADGGRIISVLPVRMTLEDLFLREIKEK